MTRSKPRTSKKKTFSEHFDLKRTQYDLDFFDCFIDKDTPLFIDPWAIKNGRDDFSSICHQKLQSMFEVLIENIRKGNRDYALELLDNLQEQKWQLRW
jgi:hypothetical protein